MYILSKSIALDVLHKLKIHMKFYKLIYLNTDERLALASVTFSGCFCRKNNTLLYIYLFSTFYSFILWLIFNDLKYSLKNFFSGRYYYAVQ